MAVAAAERLPSHSGLWVDLANLVLNRRK